jgi:hypothetical protein
LRVVTVPNGGKRSGAGRKKGSINKTSRTMRELMEAETGGVPVPVLLLRQGLKYDREGFAAESVSAISKAAEYGYPKLRHVDVQIDKDTAPKVEIVGIDL